MLYWIPWATCAALICLTLSLPRLHSWRAAWQQDVEAGFCLLCTCGMNKSCTAGPSGSTDITSCCAQELIPFPRTWLGRHLSGTLRDRPPARHRLQVRARHRALCACVIS